MPDSTISEYVLLLSTSYIQNVSAVETPCPASPHLCVVPHNNIKLYVNGNEASEISIEGGTFRNNLALESGGAIALWGAPSLVTITGGTFENNRAM